MKTHDRIIFVDFGVALDDASVAECFEKHEKVGMVVFPGVKDGIDWGLFKHKVKSGSSEPVEQMGLNFDTEIGAKISDDIYKVKSTQAKAWFIILKILLSQSRIRNLENGQSIPRCLKNLLIKVFEFMRLQQLS